MVRVVLDTNVIVSGVLSPNGAARALLDLARSGHIELVTSLVLLDEMEEVLTRFLPRLAATEFRALLEEVVYIVHPVDIPEVSRDRDDDHVLAAALAGDPPYIITRDKDLLTLHEYQGIRVLDPASGLRDVRAALGDPGEGQ